MLRELEDITGKPPVRVWELHVDDLVAPGGKPAAVRGHRVSPQELSAFGEVIEEIVGALQPAEVGSPPPGSDAA